MKHRSRRREKCHVNPNGNPLGRNRDLSGVTAMNTPIALGLIVGLAIATGQAQAQHQLFDDPRAGVAIGLSAPAAGRTPLSTVRLEQGKIADLPVGSRLAISPDASLTMNWIVVAVERLAPHVILTRCAAESDATARAMFVTWDGTTAMSLRIPSRGKSYRLHSRGGKLYEVWEIAGGPEACAHGLPNPPPDPPARLPGDDDWLPEEDATGPHDGAGCAAAMVFDTMVVYTPAARIAMGGHAAIRAEAALAVELTNESYVNSLNSARARLVYCDEIAYTESLDANGNADMDTDLDRLSGASDGFMDEVHALRDTLNADLVVMYQDTGSGLAYCTPSYGSGFSVVAWWRAAGTITHAHETGHNLSCGHDVDNEGACGPSSFGVGWRFYGNDGNPYCTVMAYEDGLYDRVTHYSNPNVSYQGVPTGNPIGDPDEAYNAAVVNNNDNTVNGFEVTRYDIYVNFAWNGPEFGTQALPYNTLIEGVSAAAVPAVGAAEIPNVYMTAGDTPWTGTIAKALTLNACGGSVIIGN
jgi:hypothetical protein